jgi:hypothetical protein
MCFTVSFDIFFSAPCFSGRYAALADTMTGAMMRFRPTVTAGF